MGKGDGKWLALGGAGVLMAGTVLFATFAAAGFAGLPGGSKNVADSGGEVVEGDVEFTTTYYDPGQGGINGSNCGGAHGRICLKSGSPTGYEVTEDSTGKKYTGAGAIPQPGSVNYDQVPLGYLHGKDWKGKGIIIPCYNDDKPFLPLDHFATSITKANRLDLAMTGAANDNFVACLQKRKIKTESAGGGFNGGTVIKGKIVELK